MWYIPPYKVKDLTDQVAAAKGLISGHIAFEMKHSAEVIPAISSMVLPFSVFRIDNRTF